MNRDIHTSSFRDSHGVCNCRPIEMSTIMASRLGHPTRPHRKSGRLWRPLDINRLLSAHAANFSLGLSPALEASRTSMSKLNCLNFPRLISDT